MKIKILVHVPKDEVGAWVDLRQGEIMNLDETVAEKLIKEGKAEFQF